MIKILYDVDFDGVYRLEDNAFIIPHVNWDELNYIWDEVHFEWKLKNEEQNN